MLDSIHNQTTSYKDTAHGRKMINLSGERFGRLLVLRTYMKPSKYGSKSFSDCLCDCGNKTTVMSASLTSGDSKSCKCLNKEIATKHGKSKHYLYRVWSSIKDRCYNPNYHEYRLYGGRKIKPVRVYSRWKKSFKCFYDYVVVNLGERPSKLHSIDRINGNYGYRPDNIRWASPKQQARNTLRNTYMTFKNLRLLTIEWSEKTGLPYGTLQNRHRQGWSDERALTTPVGTTNGKGANQIKPDLSWLIE